MPQRWFGPAASEVASIGPATGYNVGGNAGETFGQCLGGVGRPAPNVGQCLGGVGRPVRKSREVVRR